jgi:tRNA(Ile)-lysidine synthase
MSPKNLNVLSKNPNILENKLKDKKTYQIYKKFENFLDINENFIVAVSGGPDSLALAFLSKIYSIHRGLNVKFYTIDHRLRKDSSNEAKIVKKKLEKFFIKLEILTWHGKKPLKNIQSKAREKRYELLFKKCKKFKIKNILLGHHLDDLFENFFLRILRGSGLNGLVSLGKRTEYNKINLLRPLINFNKKDLVYIANHVFDFYINDPSNKDEKFKRVKIRNLLDELEKEGLDKKKFLLTIDNLKYSNETIKFYVKKNIEKNTYFLKKKNTLILNENFFKQSHEVSHRSLSDLIKFMGKKYYPVRGKKLANIISKMQNNSSNKMTLGGCIIQKINQTVILTKEH